MKRCRPEEHLHRTVADFLSLALPETVTWWHVPNGGGRSAAEAGILKAMGVKAGVPDLQFILPPGRAAFIELKPRGGVLSEPQRAMRDRLVAAGCDWALARSVEAVEATLRGWGVPLRASVGVTGEAQHG